MLQGKVVRIRWVKPYPNANNHVAIGDVIDETLNYLTMNCKTYHFGKNTGGKNAKLIIDKCTGGIIEGEKSIRSIPWSRIEVINELSPETNWDVEAVVDELGLCRLNNKQKTIITRARDTQPV